MLSHDVATSNINYPYCNCSCYIGSLFSIDRFKSATLALESMSNVMVLPVKVLTKICMVRKARGLSHKQKGQKKVIFKVQLSIFELLYVFHMADMKTVK